MSNPAYQIKARVAQIDEQLAAHDHAKRLLLAERGDLVTTLSVLVRFSGEDSVELGLEPDLESRRYDLVTAAEEEAARQEAEVEKRKPEGAPTVPEMILEVLLRPHLLGDPGLEPKAILAKIRERWWKDAPSASVGPIAWRMWKKEGRLVKDGNLYSLPPVGDRAPPGSDSNVQYSLFDAAGNAVPGVPKEAPG